MRPAARPRPFRKRWLGLGLLGLASACSKPKDATPISPAPAAAAQASPPESGETTRRAPEPTGTVASSASFLVSLTADHCPVALRVNDVPLREVEAGRRTTVGETIDPWIFAGVNSVTLEAKGKLSKGCAVLAVLGVPPGGDQRTAPRVLDASWPDADLPSGVKEFAFHGPVTERCQLFRDAQPFALGATERAELLQQARVLHQLFARRDVAGLAERADYRGKDIARCLGKSEASGVDEQKRFFAVITSEPDFVALPFDEAALRLDLVAKGKLVWLHRSDGRLLLENNRTQGMDLYAAKVAGRWTIVR